MGMPWNRATSSYLDTFLPRFLPYHHDFAEQLGAKEGDRVLVPSCGPGTEAIAFARAVGDSGRVRATDPDASWGEFLAKRFKDAGLAARGSFDQSAVGETSSAPFSIIACAFSTLTRDEELHALESWRDALATNGKIGLMAWGPVDEGDPYELYLAAVGEHSVELSVKAQGETTVDRTSLGRLFEEAGLVMVRHTVIRHSQVFTTTEEFVDALVLALRWREDLLALGEVEVQKIRARFLELAGGPGVALSFQPAATIAIAALPGEEVELPHRPSVRALRSEPA
ncbi:hypothetical protein BH09MYX1_BH09MYX1_34390 [soil metagenome]